MMGKENKAPRISSGKSSNLSKEAYNDIRKIIFLNEFRPGQKVAVKKLAERQNMSLTPVVQALKIFEHLGIVRHETNKGFFIRRVTARRVEEIYRLREMIELSLVPDIIKRLDEHGEEKLKNALDGYFSASRTKSIKVRLAKDINFHITMAKLSNQPTSVWILKYLYDLLYLRSDSELITYRPNDQSGKEHQAIFDSVLSRDMKQTKKIMQRHIRKICKGMVGGLNKRETKIEDIDFEDVNF